MHPVVVIFQRPATFDNDGANHGVGDVIDFIIAPSSILIIQYILYICKYIHTYIYIYKYLYILKMYIYIYIYIHTKVYMIIQAPDELER